MLQKNWARLSGFARTPDAEDNEFWSNFYNTDQAWHDALLGTNAIHKAFGIPKLPLPAHRGSSV